MLDIILGRQNIPWHHFRSLHIPGVANSATPFFPIFHDRKQVPLNQIFSAMRIPCQLPASIWEALNPQVQRYLLIATIYPLLILLFFHIPKATYALFLAYAMRRKLHPCLPTTFVSNWMFTVIFIWAWNFVRGTVSEIRAYFTLNKRDRDAKMRVKIWKNIFVYVVFMLVIVAEGKRVEWDRGWIQWWIERFNPDVGIANYKRRRLGMPDVSRG